MDPVHVRNAPECAAVLRADRREPPPTDLSGCPSLWIKDQSWYLHLWRFDPTIQAMLVMLDAIAGQFQNDDLDAAWERLTDDTDPAVWFQFLPIDEIGSAEDLYIKMNSRGRPLTEFETFKARLGQTIAHSGRAEEFGRKIDGPWADLLWEYRGDNDIVDDEFMRYFDFVLEICEWREGRFRGDPPIRPERRAQTLFGEDNPRHREHLEFFFNALDVWAEKMRRTSGRPSKPSSPHRRPHPGSASSAPRRSTCSSPVASGTAPPAAAHAHTHSPTRCCCTPR
jgi:hypothetical protein